ncbi:MAG: DNA polymerase III subunit gamma/tau [Clostridia bacterium]|nr:DNA polymerase III subunit gamma/tau [Clostridia bacterium]
MSYQALYRKYRPNTFQGVVGQKHITDILKNQVLTGHTTHAYLFSGTRGTGKTSTAKILARAVNCLSPVDGEPCNKCAACTIPPEANVDVIELDAASNNGVDDMRSLIEKAVFAPVNTAKKVYIIDEAHMLSSAAFNALLKTLEEPPSHVIFILATTEPHKILPTITSRCQRFDFRRLRFSDIKEYLKKVIEQTGSSIDDEGLSVIAKKANGGMRDALSLADQCISYCGNQVTAKDVYHILGTADFDAIYDLAQLLIDSDAKGALTLLDEISTGRDMNTLIQDLASHMRSLLMVKLCGTGCGEILDSTDEDIARLSVQAQNASENRLMRAIDILTRTHGDMKFYPQHNILTESALIKICRPEFETDMSAALDRIDVLEQKVKDGIKVQVQQTAVPTPVKQLPPKKKKRVVSEDAMTVFKEIADAMAQMIEDDCGFLKCSFSTAVFAEIVGGEFRLHFPTKTHCNTVTQSREQIDAILEELGYDLRLVTVADEPCDDTSLEESLLSQFPDVKICD